MRAFEAVVKAVSAADSRADIKRRKPMNRYIVIGLFVMHCTIQAVIKTEKTNNLRLDSV